jgi:glycosyltransferase involved in cell wall biosynthesis
MIATMHQDEKKTALKILIVGWLKYPFGSASASRIRTLAKGLIENGASVHVLTTSRILLREEDINNSGHNSFEKTSYETTNIVDIPGRNLSKPERLFYYVKAFIKSWKRTRQIIKSKGCNVIYIYGRSLWGYLPIVVVARLAGIPVFYDICEWFPATKYNGLFLNLRFIDDFLGRQLPRLSAKGVVAITSFIKEKYDRYRVPCILIPSVYDFNKTFNPRSSKNIKYVSSEFLAMYAGSCKVGDGVDILLKAVQCARDKGCPVHLHIIGTDGLRGDAKQYRLQCEDDEVLINCVTFRGRLSDEEYPLALAQANCLILPRPDTQINRAGFPTRLPEFLATGCPVITSDIPDVNLYLEAGVHAEIVPANCAESLADGMCRIWKSKERAEKIGSAGQKRCMEIFDYRMYTKKLYDLLEKSIVR